MVGLRFVKFVDPEYIPREDKSYDWPCFQHGILNASDPLGDDDLHPPVAQFLLTSQRLGHGRSRNVRGEGKRSRQDQAVDPPSPGPNRRTTLRQKARSSAGVHPEERLVSVRSV